MVLTSAELTSVINCVKSAGALALKTKSEGVSVTHKENDEGPLTNVDKKVNSFLISELQKIFPLDHIISEEALPIFKNPTHNRTWFIDPIDGTNDFIKGNTEWCIMIGLCVDERAVFGIVSQPEEDHIYFGGKGIKATKLTAQKEIVISVKKTEHLVDSINVQSRYHPDSKVSLMLDSIGSLKSYSYGSIGLKFAHISEGRADFYLNFSGRCKAWDLCAPQAILEASGGSVYYFDEGLNGNQFIYSTQPVNNYSVVKPFQASGEGLKQKLLTSVLDYIKKEQKT